MVSCKKDFGSGDYREFLETGLADPATGEALFVGVHNECRGSTVLKQSEMPEVTDVGSYADYVAGANEAVRDTIENAAGTMMVAYQSFIGDPQLRQTIGSINLYDPGIADVPAIQNGLQAIQDTAEARLRHADGIEFEELATMIADLKTTGQDLQEMVESSDYFAVVSPSIDSLKAMQIPAADIENAMQPPANINENVAAPGAIQVKP